MIFGRDDSHIDGHDVTDAARSLAAFCAKTLRSLVTLFTGRSGT